MILGIILKNDTWHNIPDSIIRLYYATYGTTFMCSGGTATYNGFVVYSSLASGGYNKNLATNFFFGDTSIRGSLTSSGTLYANSDKLKFSKSTKPI